MAVQILRQQGTRVQFLLAFMKNIDCQYISVRTNFCLSGTQSYSRRKALLSMNKVVPNVQKRHKLQEPPSDIGVYFEPKKKVPTNQTLLEEVSDGLEIIKKGIPLYKQELLERINFDQDIFPEHGDFEYFQRFNGNVSLKNWLVSADRDTDQGKSSATFALSSTGSALFQGYLNTDVPKDGVSKRAGFCNIRSPLKKLAFDRQVPYDWSRYTHMYLKVRGDGRNYMLVIQMDRHFDIQMYDVYNFPLYTRGGPYWQIVKVPFSSFFLAAQGRTQDKQQRINLEKIKYLSITAADGVKGPFKLEIDYIAFVRDMLAHNTKDFKYELYQKKSWET